MGNPIEAGPGGHTFENEGANYELVVEAHDEPPPADIDTEALRDLHDPPCTSRPPRSLAVRSFSIRDAATGERVFDSKSGLKRLLASLAPDLRDNAASDGRGRCSMSIGRVDGRLFAYIRLESLGGIAVLDLTNPRSPEFVDYHHQRRNEGGAGS